MADIQTLVQTCGKVFSAAQNLSAFSQDRQMQNNPLLAKVQATVVPLKNSRILFAGICKHRCRSRKKAWKHSLLGTIVRIEDVENGV